MEWTWRRMLDSCSALWVKWWNLLQSWPAHSTAPTRRNACAIRYKNGLVTVNWRRVRMFTAVHQYFMCLMCAKTSKDCFDYITWGEVLQTKILFLCFGRPAFWNIWIPREFEMFFFHNKLRRPINVSLFVWITALLSKKTIGFKKGSGCRSACGPFYLKLTCPLPLMWPWHIISLGSD